jgi:hypothetical protein
MQNSQNFHSYPFENIYQNMNEWTQGDHVLERTGPDSSNLA